MGIWTSPVLWDRGYEYGHKLWYMLYIVLYLSTHILHILHILIQSEIVWRCLHLARNCQYVKCPFNLLYLMPNKRSLQQTLNKRPYHSHSCAFDMSGKNLIKVFNRRHDWYCVFILKLMLRRWGAYSYTHPYRHVWRPIATVTWHVFVVT